MGVDSRYWSGRRVFLTGHTGFKGAWLSLLLAQMGAQVTGYSLDPPTEQNLFGTARVRERLAADHRANVLDLPVLQEALIKSDADTVIHMAAQSLVREGYRDPVQTYAVNVLGTVNVLEAARLTPAVTVAVIVTSDKCYDNREAVHAYRESDPVGGRDPYSGSKACAELVTASYRASFASTPDSRPAIASARAGNVIGGGDWAADRLIPDCIRAFAAGEPLTLRYPNAVRPWQYVLDPLAGYLLLAQNLAGADRKRYTTAWNFGPDPASELTVSEVAGRVGALWGDRAKVKVGPAPMNLRESELLRLDSTKARAELGWRPNWSLERSLVDTVSWYRAWHRGEDMQRFSVAQIDAYLRVAA